MQEILIYEGGVIKKHQIPPDSILFIDKDYPNCSKCFRKYLTELGCIPCMDEAQRFILYKGQKYHNIYVPKVVKPRSNRNLYKSIWKKMELGYK